MSIVTILYFSKYSSITVHCVGIWRHWYRAFVKCHEITISWVDPAAIEFLQIVLINAIVFPCVDINFQKNKKKEENAIRLSWNVAILEWKFHQFNANEDPPVSHLNVLPLTSTARPCNELCRGSCVERRMRLTETRIASQEAIAVREI